jgi:hypothetical protein
MSTKLIAAVFIAATSSAPLLAATTVIHAGHLIAEPGKISFVMKEGKIFKDER